MRVKAVVCHLRLRARAKLVWSRITLSRLTTAYFLITAIHCFIQIVLQSHAFSINASAADGLWSLLVQANLTGEANGLAILSNDLRICYVLPDRINQTDCPTVIWTGNKTTPALSYGIDAASVSTSVTSPITSSNQAASPVITSIPVSTLAIDAPETKTVTTSSATVVRPTPVNKNINGGNDGSDDKEKQEGDDEKNEHEGDDGEDDDGDGDQDELAKIVQQLQGVRNKREVQVLLNSDSNNFTVTGLPIDGRSTSTQVTLSTTCVKTLIWPVQKLDNTKREDITLIAFQFWVMSMSIVALLNESIPHLFAAVVTQSVVAAWTIQQIFATQSFRDDFVRLTVNGACDGHNLLGHYWANRKNAEIASVVLNVADMLLVGFLTYKLVKIYSWQTYKRIGASLTINRIYKLVLCLSVAIQLALFFIVVAASLWLDQLYHGAAARLSTHRTMYQVFLIIVACLLVPWLTLGWFAIRREMRKSCVIFLILNVIFITVWALLYGSTSFRWTFALWSFFSVMSVAAGILVASTLGLGLACRLNFGKGLPQYLNFQQPIDGVDFAPVFPDGHDEKAQDPEKVDFPSFYRSSSTLSIPDQRVLDKAAQQRAESNSTTHLARTDTLMSHTSQNSMGSNKTMEKRMVIE